MNNKFVAIREEANRDGIGQQYKIVFAHNRNYTIARIRYENYGPHGAGWNVRCSECDEDIECAVRSKFFQMGRRFPLSDALAYFSQAYESTY